MQFRPAARTIYKRTASLPSSRVTRKQMLPVTALTTPDHSLSAACEPVPRRCSLCLAPPPPLATCAGNEMKLNPLYEDFIKAGEQAGYGVTEVYNGYRNAGFEV